MKKVSKNDIVVMFLEDSSDFILFLQLSLKIELFWLCRCFKDVFFNRYFSAYQTYQLYHYLLNTAVKRLLFYTKMLDIKTIFLYDYLI